MKIKFESIIGNVGIDDQSYFQQAYAGQTLDTFGKQHLIVTAENSSATLLIEGKHINLPPKSYLYTDRTSPGVIDGAFHDIRHVVGILWSKISSGEERLDKQGNAVIGVRG